MNVSFVTELDYLLIFPLNSMVSSGPDHYHEDDRRCHLHPNIPFLLDQFQAVEYSTLETISLKAEIKQQLREFIDQIYDELCLNHLKSKKFIDSLGDWGSILKE